MEGIKERFVRDGYFAPIDILEGDEIIRLREQFNRLEVESVGAGGIDFKERNWHVKSNFIQKLSTHPKILSALRELIGEDILLFSARIFCKYPGDGQVVFWHQDSPYWGFEPSSAVIVWYAVDDSTVENGALQVLPRSQNRSHFTPEQLGEKAEFRVLISEQERAQIRTITLRAGQCSIHHSNLVHGSEANTSQMRRCGITMRYVPSHVRQVRESWRGDYFSAVCVSGSTRNVGIPLVSFPSAQS